MGSGPSEERNFPPYELAIADRGYAVETGRIAASGSAAELLADDRVQAAYLGV